MVQPILGQLFDLHFEIGLTPSGDFYARTMLGNLIMEESGDTPAKAVAKVAKDMENNNFWAVIVSNPSISSYPFGTSTKKPVVAATKPDPNIVRKKPMELTQVSHPECQALCTSFDHFGKGKCKSMCGQRTGL
jgi:hypothetical protein